MFDGQWPLVTRVNDIGIYSYTVVLITVILFFLSRYVDQYFVSERVSLLNLFMKHSWF